MVSVLVPVYNKSERELRRCFESILQQTYKDIELIITDDGSDAEVATFLDEYANSNNIRCMGGIQCFHYPNGGVWTARNRGQEKASGEWIMHINADDYISHATIETAINSTSQNENVDMVYWSLWDVDWPQYIYKNSSGDSLFRDPNKLFIRQSPLCSTPFCDVTCVVRRENAKPFNPNLIGAEFERQVRVISSCRAIYFIDAPLYNYVPSPNTISSTQADINWLVMSIADFRDALVSNGLNPINGDITTRAISVIHKLQNYEFSEYKKVDKSAVSDVVCSISTDELVNMTCKMKIICVLFRLRMFFLLNAILRVTQCFKTK